MAKIAIRKAVPYVAGICLPFLAVASQTETIRSHSTIEESSALAANRRTKALLNETPRLNPLQTVDSPIKVELSAQDFLLKNYTDVAIATDLEPDDVLALALLFEEANRIHAESPNGKYLINLIIVGEGNTTIKRMRMEKMLQEYFNIPAGVTIKVVEGRATKDNVFSYDGEEFFDKLALEQIPFPEEDNRALETLSDWAAQAENPLVVQLKPAPELVYLDAELAAKTTVFFYGSFNIRKTATDSIILNDPQLAFAALPTFSAKLEGLMSYLSNRFSKIAVLETFGVLGDQPSVCSEFEWTNKIAHMIANSENKFIQMFRTVSSHWNAYILGKFLDDCKQLSENLIQEPRGFTDFFVDIYENLAQLQQAWNQDQFAHLYQNIANHSAEISDQLSGDVGRNWKTLTWKIGLINKMGSSDIQFTLSDVLVAMATTDNSNFFQATPIQISYDENGFLVPAADAKSNVVYYQALDREKVASVLEEFLSSKMIDHSLRQPPFGQSFSFTPAPESIKKTTYEQLGLKPRVIYAQDDLRGSGQITDGFKVLESDTVVFLIGPSYAGTPVAKWRLDVIEHLASYLPVDTVLVVPQYKHVAFADGPGGKDTQIEWEHQWLERSNIMAINLSLHFQNPNGSIGNIGPTTRFETGYYFAKSPEKEVLVFIPNDPQPSGLAWVDFHARHLNIPVHHEYPEFYQAILDICHSRSLAPEASTIETN